jgi:biopolymer transport protein ExbD
MVSRRKKRSRIEMAPMVDVVFQLLIFFLVASEVRPAEADFETNIPAEGRPPDTTRREKLPEVNRVVIKNAAMGGGVEVTLNGAKLDATGWPRQLEDRLAGAVKSLKSDEREVLLVINADDDVTLQDAARALDAGVAAGVERITLSRPRPGSRPSAP